MPAFVIALEPVECSPLDDVCRTVSYAADQFGVRLDEVSCDVHAKRYRAVVVGANDALVRLESVLRSGFPDTRLSLSPLDPFAPPGTPAG